MTDLLDLLRQQEAGDKPPCRPWIDKHACGCPVHVLLPSMAYACGDYLSTPGHHVMSANDTDWPEVTCPDCIEIGQAEIRATWRAMRPGLDVTP